MPRTTLEIDAPLLDELKRLAEKDGSSMGRVASDLLAEALASKPVSGRRTAFTWNARRMSARVDLADKDALHAILDRPSLRRRRA